MGYIWWFKEQPDCYLVSKDSVGLKTLRTSLPRLYNNYNKRGKSHQFPRNISSYGPLAWDYGFPATSVRCYLKLYLPSWLSHLLLDGDEWMESRFANTPSPWVRKQIISACALGDLATPTENAKKEPSQMEGSEEAAVSGNIFIETHDDEGEIGTLDEPISSTLVSPIYTMIHRPKNVGDSHVIFTGSRREGDSHQVYSRPDTSEVQQSPASWL